MKSLLITLNSNFQLQIYFFWQKIVLQIPENCKGDIKLEAISK